MSSMYEEAVYRVLNPNIIYEIKESCEKMPSCHLCRFSIQGLAEPEKIQYQNCIFQDCPESWEL